MNFYQRLLQQVTEIARSAVGNMVRTGTVHEVKGDKMRVVLGVDNDGKPILSPWLNTSNHRGGARERRFYKGPPKGSQQGSGAGSSAGGAGAFEGGQNVMLICPGGDPRQAMVIPYAPNKNYLAPDHANKSGQDEETYQLEDLRVKKTKEGYDIWLQPPKQQQQQQGEAQKLPQPQGDASGQAQMKIRLNKNGGFTGRIGKNIRVAAHSKGAKVRAGNNFASTTEGKVIVKAASGPLFLHGGPIFINSPPILKDAPADPIPNDDG